MGEVGLCVHSTKPPRPSGRPQQRSSSWKDTNQVKATVLTTMPREQVGVWKLGQPRATPGSKGIVNAPTSRGGFDQATNICPLEDDAKGILHWDVVDLDS